MFLRLFWDFSFGPVHDHTGILSFLFQAIFLNCIEDITSRLGLRAQKRARAWPLGAVLNGDQS